MVVVVVAAVAVPVLVLVVVVVVAMTIRMYAKVVLTLKLLVVLWRDFRLSLASAFVRVLDDDESDGQRHSEVGE